ncbi:hypothetical protein [Paenibacillus lutrae]|nr:hypothetical protein [Paenibacillus lutrae]
MKAKDAAAMLALVLPCCRLGLQADQPTEAAREQGKDFGENQDKK